MKDISDRESKEWYASLNKPSFAPPAWVFGPVWLLLYISMAVAFGGALSRVAGGSIPVSIGFALLFNIIFNFSFSPIQFRLKNNKLAAYDSLLIVVTLIWFMIEIFAYLPWALYILIPYLLWTLFATYLQFTIASMNK